MTTDFIETYRGGASAWECDAFGHLNIAFYPERFGDAGRALIERLAPDLAAGAWRMLSLRTLYKAEFRAGDALVIRSALAGAEGAELTLQHEALNAAGEVTTIAEQRLALEGPDAARRLAALAGNAQPSADFAPLALPEASGPVASGRDRVKPWELDEGGGLSLLGHVQRFSTACLHLLGAIGITGAYMRREKRGFSTFETLLALSPPAPAAGAGVALSSALLDIGNSSLKMLHDMRLEDGRRVARFYQAGVHFDLATRRSTAVPAALRERGLALRQGG